MCGSLCSVVPDSAGPCLLRCHDLLIASESAGVTDSPPLFAEGGELTDRSYGGDIAGAFLLAEMCLVRLSPAGLNLAPARTGSSSRSVRADEEDQRAPPAPRSECQHHFRRPAITAWGWILLWLSAFPVMSASCTPRPPRTDERR